MRIMVFSIVLTLMAGTALALHPGKSSVKTEEVAYRSGATVMNGYLAYPENVTGKVPGVLVVHEWWGHNEYARTRARMLAEMGYAALAVDMYGGGKQARHPDEASAFSREAMQNMEVMRARFLAALEFLRMKEFVDPERTAGIGYCFGGAVVLRMARDGVDLKGVASFHGSLATEKPAAQGAVKAKILVLHGEEDGFVTAEQMERFREEMKAAGADFEIITYKGAKHSFTNPDADRYAREFNIPLGYDRDADTKSWADLKRLLGQVFGR